jgi:hypothetical protein
MEAEVLERAKARLARDGRTVGDAVRDFLQDLGRNQPSAKELDELFARLEIGHAERMFTRDEMNER